MLFDKNKKNPWPEPEKCVGQPCNMNIRGTQVWEAIGPAGEAMKGLYPHIRELLENNQEQIEHDEEKPRGIGFNMWMEGKDPGSSQPIIVVSSKSRGQRSRAKELLKQSRLLDNYPHIKIKTLDKMPAVYRAFSRKKDRGETGVADTEDLDDIYIRCGHKNPGCGSLISFGNSRLTTLSSLLVIDGTLYGLTAQHARWIESYNGALSEDEDTLAFDEDSDDEHPEDVELTSRGNLFHYRSKQTELMHL